MPLTSLELTVDQNRSGWLPQAGRDGADLLGAQGRPQMASALREAFERQPELSTLQTYLRLRLVEGIAPAVLRPVSHDQRGGALDGRAFSPGRVPMRPSLSQMNSASDARDVWRLTIGSTLISHHRTLTSPTCTLESLALMGGSHWRTNNTLRPEGVITHACSDGESLALLRCQKGQEPECLLTDPELQSARWRRPVGFLSDARPAHVTLALVDQTVVLFDATSGQLAGLSRESGEELWRQQIPGDTILSVPLRLVGPHLCLFPKRTLHVFDAATGQLRWSHDGAAIGPYRAWGAGEHLYIEREGGLNWRYDLPTGERLSLREKLSPSGGQAPAMAQARAASDEMTVVLQGNRLYAVRLVPDYPIAWTRELPPHAAPHDRPSTNRLFVVGETAILARENILSAYDLHSGEPLWEGLGVPKAPSKLRGHPGGLMWSAPEGGFYMLSEEAADPR